MSRPKKPADILNKKMPENPRYKHIKPMVDTGASLRRYLEVIDDIRRNFKFRKDEVFKRIKLPTLVNLMIEVTRLKLKKLELQENERNIEQDVITANESDKLDDKSTEKNKTDSFSPRSSFQSLIMGVGELDVPDETGILEKVDALLPSEDPYLLLDVRSQDEFASCRIITAENYPMTMLARTMDFESKSLLRFKNKPGKIIVMYDDEETRAPKVATTLVQRGYENIYMLSGGLKYAADKFPKGLISGVLPPNCQTKAKPKKSSSCNVSSENQEQLQDSFTEKNIDLLEEQLHTFFIPGAPGSVQSTRTASSTGSKVPGTRGILSSRATSKCSSAISKATLLDTAKSSPWK